MSFRTAITSLGGPVISRNVLPKILLALGWIIFVTSCYAGLDKLAWGLEVLVLLAGPALMFVALVLKRRYRSAQDLEERPPASLRCVSPPGGTAR